MFIQTQETEDPKVLRFLPGKKIAEGQSIRYINQKDAKESPLAEKILSLNTISSVEFTEDYIQISTNNGGDWASLKSEILFLINDYFAINESVFLEPSEQENSKVLEKLEDIISKKVMPAIRDDKGKVQIKKLTNTLLELEMNQAAMGYRTAIERMIKHFVPEIKKIISSMEGMPKPNLKTEEARVVQKILDEKINPAVAGHGGHISLIDVKDSVAYIRLEGGCQGCGMATVTLKQGVEKQILHDAPMIKAVLDTTDHASGKNPYYTG